MDRIRNEYIRGTAQVGRFGDKVREARLRWFGHVHRRVSGVYREKDVEDGAARQEEKRKAKEEVHGCGEGGHAGGWRHICGHYWENQNAPHIFWLFYISCLFDCHLPNLHLSVFKGEKALIYFHRERSARMFISN